MKSMYSVKEFCTEHGISRALFYNLLKRGLGPRTAKLGSRTLISAEAALEWRQRMEAATQTRAA